MTRRTLRFANLPAVVAEAERLLAGGYTRGGTWSLGQISEHLTLAINGSTQGYPYLLPAPGRWVIRWFFLDKIKRRETFQGKVGAPRFLQPPDSMDDRVGVDHLRTAIQRFATAQPLHPSPIFGKLTREEWEAVHLWHCEHHFSFLHPAANSQVRR
ncbi:MAG: DUF1569 domain-containing protein [Gemmataceae bacterium]